MAHRRSTEIHRDMMVLEYLTGNMVTKYSATSTEDRDTASSSSNDGHSTKDEDGVIHSNTPIG